MKNPLSLIEGRKPLLDIGLKSILKKLNSPQTFFFTSRESQVDWGGHDNDLEYLTSEYIEFDRAIGVALKFVDENPNTLLIVTADHETGGLGITSSKVEKLNLKSEIFNKRTHSFNGSSFFNRSWVKRIFWNL